MDKSILITGGAGFIGSHVVEQFAEEYPDYSIVVMDILTYAGDEHFFKNLEIKYRNVLALRQDITDFRACSWIINDLKIDNIIHLAAESHVDNSIENPIEFVNTNVISTVNLLNAAKKMWGNDLDDKLFYHISTDEVYGALGKEGFFTEETPYNPHSPYSASKASADHFVRAFHDTYKLPTIISNCLNNYGPRQHYEKLIPKVIHNLIKGIKIPIYGTGENVRDWLFVKDHVKAIDTILHKGKIGETYNIGGDCELSNIELVKNIINIYIDDIIDDMDNDLYFSRLYSDFIEFVEDRKGHDFGYAINHNKLTEELG